MLRISKLADYATLIMSHLAQDTAKLCSASLLANSLGLSQAVVSKILKILGRAGLVHSVRGAEGGYRLARSAQDITLAAVVSAIEGKMAVTECCSQRSVCTLDSSCTTKNHWKNINNVIYSTLERVTIKDLSL